MKTQQIELRDYQEEAVQSFFDYFNGGGTGNPLIIAATGAGKSVIIGRLIQRILTEYPGQRIIMATHVKELIEQNFIKLKTFWPDSPAGIYSAGIGKRQPWFDIVCGGIQSMYKKTRALGHRDLLFIDEAHLLSSEGEGMYISFINELKKINPYVKVVGFTATPWRLKGGHLIEQDNAIFTDEIYEIGIGELVKRGYLTRLTGKSSVIQADLSKVKKLAGEFNQKDAEAALDKAELTEAALNEVEVWAADRQKFLYFCQGIEHSHHVADALRLRGVPAQVITSKTPKLERERILREFKTSQQRGALVNNAVLTTGIDLPNIDCIVLLRATASTALLIQMAGRGMRLHPGKENCLLLDFAGNIQKHGAIDLITSPKRRLKSSGDAPHKICDNCRESIHAAARECPECGYIFPEAEKQKHEAVATAKPVMSDEIKPEYVEVTEIRYKGHVGKSGYPTLQVSYYDDYGIIANEFVCFSHPDNSFPKRKAGQWWAARRGEKDYSELPKTTSDALAACDDFLKPKGIFIRKNGKFMEVLSHVF